MLNTEFLKDILDEKRYLLLLTIVAQDSRSQLSQDLFVLYQTNLKRNGFFVEFGATDGVSLSNTYLLEKHFQWNGIVAEPGRSWHEKLEGNRNCIVDKRCVWRSSGEVVDFADASVHELSTIAEF